LRYFGMATVERPTSEPLDPTQFLSHPDALYEVEDGKVVELPEKEVFATLVACRTYSLLSDFTRRAAIGLTIAESLFLIDSARNLRRRPDVAFVSRSAGR
jgi:hypothetical protein